VRFVNRQQGSGTRMVLDLLLERARMSGADIDGMENVELTHAAIAAYIASGKADAGLGVEAAARQFDLDFVPVLTERYFLVCAEATLADPRFAATLAYLRGPAFRASLLEHPGYDGTDAGAVATPAEAFGPGAG
jgi:molybdate-binding protein